MCANERFLMEGPRWGNSETKGYIGLHNYTRPVPHNSPIPTTWPIIRHNLAENHTSFQTKGEKISNKKMFYEKSLNVAMYYL